MAHEIVLVVCGYQLPRMIVTVPRLLEIVFRTDRLVEGTGFRAEYTGYVVSHNMGLNARKCTFRQFVEY